MISVLVSVAESASFVSVVAGLAEAGMRVERALPEILTVVGRVDEDRLGSLRKVEGVVAVERGGGGFQVPHPGSGVQ